MKVLKVSEALTGIEQSIKKKEKEQEQLLSIREAMHKVIDLEDALKGEGGTAIKEYFKVLHIPVLLLLNQFLDQYIQSLKDIQMNVRNYEAEDGMVREDFITTEVKNGLNKLFK
ncbi:T7SS effector LXG polymorphic toxin [Halobacillus ihumii]|uniref:T7SS effector LXG polymorphic toxin n=1 Tax=Halobacillus ihumii TaxID=2686092 RepID=UPI0013D4BF9A|nr:T7SS effector LXG polymorphic toxin [Halobacillus ihumii]